MKYTQDEGSNEPVNRGEQVVTIESARCSHCPQCGKAVHGEQAICTICGYRLVRCRRATGEGRYVCGDCKRPVAHGDGCCGTCGSALLRFMLAKDLRWMCVCGFLVDNPLFRYCGFCGNQLPDPRLDSLDYYESREARNRSQRTL